MMDSGGGRDIQKEVTENPILNVWQLLLIMAKESYQEPKEMATWEPFVLKFISSHLFEQATICCDCYLYIGVWEREEVFIVKQKSFNHLQTQFFNNHKTIVNTCIPLVDLASPGTSTNY